MNISVGTNQTAADADFAWLEARGRRIRLRRAAPGERRSVPEGMVPATLSMITADDVLIRIPLAIEPGADVASLSEAGCRVVLERLRQQDKRVERMLVEAAGGLPQ